MFSFTSRPQLSFYHKYELKLSKLVYNILNCNNFSSHLYIIPFTTYMNNGLVKFVLSSLKPCYSLTSFSNISQTLSHFQCLKQTAAQSCCLKCWFHSLFYIKSFKDSLSCQVSVLPIYPHVCNLSLQIYHFLFPMFSNLNLSSNQSGILIVI